MQLLLSPALLAMMLTSQTLQPPPEPSVADSAVSTAELVQTCSVLKHCWIAVQGTPPWPDTVWKAPRPPPEQPEVVTGVTVNDIPHSNTPTPAERALPIDVPHSPPAAPTAVIVQAPATPLKTLLTQDWYEAVQAFPAAHAPASVGVEEEPPAPPPGAAPTPGGPGGAPFWA